MIVTKLQGGMANQMFQFAMGLAVAHRFHTRLYFNTRSFDRDKMRQYSLGLWGLPNAIQNGTAGYQLIQEKGLPFNASLVAHLQNNTILSGYWQTEKYFAHLRGDLKLLFTPEGPWDEGSLELRERIQAAGPCSTFLTIRRTDYLTSDFHGMPDATYYRSALNAVRDHLGMDPTVFVFSDDPEWCQKELELGHPFTVAGNFNRTTKNHLGREDLELSLMFQCQNAICANSSYSWWGAWLGADMGNGLVVAPKRWFLSTTEDSRDIVPARWLQL